MKQFRAFEDIQAWQEGRVLTRAVRGICKREHVRRDYAFVDQVTRAARSVTANIAEGNDAMTAPEFIQFLGIAKRSAAEVRSHLYDALDEAYITREEFKELSLLATKITRMIAGLIHHLQQTPKGYKRTFKSSSPIN